MSATYTDAYSIPTEHLEFRDMVRQLAVEQVGPRAAEIDATDEYPQDIRELLSEQDILALPIPAEYGGTGTGTLVQQMAVEELAKQSAVCALMLMIQELGTLPITLFGSDELKQRFLPKCATGEWTPAFCLSEPDAGSNAAAMRTHAVQDGDDWIINGTKAWITNASIANFYVVFAVTDQENKRITAFVVEADREGLSVPKHEHKLGINGIPTGTPVFDNVRVPSENVIGEVGRGMRVALGTLERTRLGAAAQAVGISQGATDYALAYAKERTSFGKPILELQSIAFKIADMQTRTSAARELLYSACAKMDRGEPDKALYSSMAKLFASDTAMAVTVEAVQVLGGYGYTKEYPVERMMRDAKITQIYEGTNEIQRVVIAKQLGG